MWNVVVLLATVWAVWWFVTRAGRTPRRQGPAKGRVPGPAAPSTQPAEQPSTPTPTPAPVVTEDVTAVLRRQVPPRDEPARSWLGGLPRLPDHVAWPRLVSSERPEEGERPLHFVAQVACADLPAGLWGGLGPRTGWLVFFLDPNDGTPDETGSHAVLHVDELGPEREAPCDLGPVHDGVHTGGSYRWMPTDQVPSVWRRWPVDVVAFPNRVHERDGRSVVTPDDFAETLHDGAPVGAGSALRAQPQALDGWLDPQRRAQLPQEVADDLAADARRLDDNRPHRMGGYHDGVQSDAVAGPSADLLLLQLTSDDAMDWCWGDVGAYYFWVRSDHLASGDLSGAQLWLECH